MKKFISLAAAVTVLCAAVFSVTAFAWQGEEDYNKRLEFVSANELEVYVEGSSGNAPYYGARLEPRTGIYFGTLADHADMFDGDFSTCLTYVEFDSMQSDLYYPANDMVRNNNINAVIGWNVSSADTIRNIDAYTDYIEQTVKTFSEYGKNMYIRFGAEMNNIDLGTGEEFCRAFRKVADAVHKYDNLAMVWSPLDMGSIDRPFADFYPGDEYVDWIGVNSYQIKYFLFDKDASETNKVLWMTGNYAWHTNSLKPLLSFMSEYNINKPVMISEGGVANGNNYGEDTSDWAAPRLRNMYWDIAMQYPQVKMINYFNTQMSWENEFFSLDGHDDLISIIREAVASGAFISRNSGNDFTFTPPYYAGMLIGTEIPVYAHAYAKDAESIRVDYYIDGVFYDSTAASPHKTVIKSDAISDGAHTMSVYSYSGDTQLNSKELKFDKLGAFILFGENAAIVSDKSINVSLNGNQIQFDVEPCVVADRTLVPIRAFLNALGIDDSDIEYDGAENTVTIKYGGDTIKLYINNPTAYVNGVSTEIDVPPCVIDGRTLVPLRFISESFNCDVSYSDSGSVLDVFLTEK